MREKSELYWKLLKDFYTIRKKKKKPRKRKNENLDEELYQGEPYFEDGLKW